MAFGPTLPQTNALISAAELRTQFTGLNSLIAQCPTNSTVNSMNNSALATVRLAGLSGSV